MNLSLYVSGDPVNARDPSGMRSCADSDPQKPQRDPCPKDKRRFFNWLDGPLGDMATDLNTSKVLLLTLAASEGGWTDGALDHNMPLNNPFGVNRIQNGRAAGNRAYSTLTAAIGSWESMFGDNVSGADSPQEFIGGLLTPAKGQRYNSANADYKGQYLRVYQSMLKFMKLCGIK